MDLAMSAVATLQRWDAAIARFDFVQGVTPLSSSATPVVAVGTYLAVLAVCKVVVTLLPGLDLKQRLKPVVLFHNAWLSVASLVLLVALVHELVWQWTSSGGGVGGLWRVWCDPPPRHFDRGNVFFIYYINYLLKFYEMLDSVLMILRRNPVPFLHVYHHAATLVLCWSQLYWHSTTQWVPIGLNLAVHVLMYYYYAVATLGKKVWWKRHLTTLQIVQFVVDVAVCGYATVLKYGHDHGTPWGVDCGGTTMAGYFGTGLLLSYLVLFINFFFISYVSKAVKGTPKGKLEVKKKA